MTHRLLIPLALLAAILPRTAHAAPAVGDQVIYHVNAGEDRTAVVTGIVSGTTVDIVAFSNGSDFGDGNPGWMGAAIYTNVTPGTSFGQYSTGTSVADLVSGLGYLQPPVGSSPGLSLAGGAIQLSASRTVLLTVRGTASMVSGQGFVLELRCDAGSTPTAVVDDATGSLSDAPGATVVVPWKLVAMAPPGQYCQVVQASGAASLTLTGATAATL